MPTLCKLSRWVPAAVCLAALIGCGGGGGSNGSTSGPAPAAPGTPTTPTTPKPPTPPPPPPPPAVFSLTTPTIHATPLFDDTWVDGVVLADIDGDGRKDAIVSTTFYDYAGHPDRDWMLYIFHQLPDGALASPIVIPYSSRAQQIFASGGMNARTALGTADLNADGIDDVVVGQRLGVAIVFGRRDRAYVAKHVNNATGVISGGPFEFFDADRDGHLDIVALNEANEQTAWGLTVFFGDPAGAFTRQRFTVTTNDGDVELHKGDLNGDGIVDVAIAYGQGLSWRVEILYGNGAGEFPTKLVIPKPGGLQRLLTMVVGDFSGGDGRDDLIVAGNDLGFTGGKYFLYRQVNGALSTTPAALPWATPKDTADIPDTSIAADLNGDGRTDLLTVRSGGKLGYFEQRNSELSQEQLFDGPYQSWGGLSPIAVGDLNGDGCADVATANYNYGLVVWPGYGCAARPAGTNLLISRLF